MANDPGGEGRERGEVHRGQDAAGVHVLDPLVHVVAAGSDLVEALRLEAVLLLGSTGHGVERRGLHDDLAERPDVGALVVADQLGRPVLVLGVEVVDEQVGRLDDVVVDADQDEVVGSEHGVPLAMRIELSLVQSDLSRSGVLTCSGRAVGRTL